MVNPLTQGSAALHPGLYAAARYRGLVECFHSELRKDKLHWGPGQGQQEGAGLF